METLFFSKNTIKELLRAHKHELDVYDELLIGLVLANFHVASGVKEVSIGFAIKRDVYRSMPSKGKTNLLLVEALFRVAKETDTPIDIVIAFNNVASMPNKTNDGVSYQLKRFRKNIGGDSTKPLIEYVNKAIPKKYAPVRTRLLIIPERTKLINWAQVKAEFHNENFPFEAIMFFVISEQKPFIGEVWPTPGMSSYSVKELLA